MGGRTGPLLLTSSCRPYDDAIVDQGMFFFFFLFSRRGIYQIAVPTTTAVVLPTIATTNPACIWKSSITCRQVAGAFVCALFYVSSYTGVM